MATLITLCFAVAVGAFVLALPLKGTRAGAVLLRTAGVAFLLALLPALLVGLTGNALVPSGRGGGAENALAGIGLLTLLILGAYAALWIRKRFGSKQRDAWGEYISQKSSGKQVIDRNAEKVRSRAAVDDGLF
ncbi:MAG: hypothetical protein KJ062_23420 [Thermoanaerobaculia bacterium]|nr:hypothetical protein [Thermoanaerobaculia bacterium]